MSNPVTSVRHLTAAGDGRCLGRAVLLWCPGCEALHMPRFRCPEHGRPDGPVWDGDPEAEPFTMSPSLLVHGTPVSPRCHSYVRSGRWEYLPDSTHPLAGQTVPLPPLPDWVL